MDPALELMPTSRRRLLAAATSVSAVAVLGCGKTIQPLLLPSTGLDFPGSSAVRTTMRFRFPNPLAIYPATYLWRAFPRRQSGYYTAFFWGNDDGQGDLRTFLWTKDKSADSYYGAHPYPQPAPRGTNHRWEVAIDRDDVLGGEVQYDRWFTQALRVWANSRGKHHEFYWDLPFTDSRHRVAITNCPSWGNTPPPAPTLTWGDAPWAPGNEVWNGILSGIQIYSDCLNLDDMLSEASVPRSTAVGARSLWYENLSPSPQDISDKSGRGHHPQWVGVERPRLWSR
jgi:hypothetical protein